MSQGYSGNPPNTPGGQSPCTGSTGDGLCDCIGTAIDGIQCALHEINDTLKYLIKKPCDQIDECIDEIWDKIKKKVEGPVWDCDQCLYLAKQGMAGTIEYAVRCAHCAVEESSHQCSAGDPESWGKPCSGCNKEPCCCNQGICEPCPEDEKPKKRYIGWCNRQSGIVVVTEDDGLPPGPDFVQVALSEDESQARFAAAQYCQNEKPTNPPPADSPVNIPSFGTGTCSLTVFQSGQSLANLFSAGAGAEFFAATRNTMDNIEKMLVSTQDQNSASNALIGATIGMFKTPFQLASNLGPAIGKAVGCTSPEWLEAFNVLACLKFLEKQTGVSIEEFKYPYTYGMNAICRQRHLDPDKAIAAYLAHQISYQELDTHWSIAGYCSADVKQYTQAARAKPVPMQLAFLRRRSIITSSDYEEGMRQLGYLEPVVSENLFKLTEQVPSLSDIIHLMVRDADDESPGGPVKRFNLDANFEDKWGSSLREYAEWQGVTERVARLNWRAHWSIPSPTQLFEFWHRLRKDESYPTLEDDIKAALIQQDILPYWHKHFFATSYRPIGRVDIRRAYQIGQITDDELPLLYAQLGYSDETSEKLSKFTRKLRDVAAFNHRAVKLYTKFTIDRHSALKRMMDDGLPQEVADRALTDVEGAFETSDYAKAFVAGNLGRSDLIASLQNHGVSGAGASRIADLLSIRLRDHTALRDYIAGTAERHDALAEMQQDGIPTPIVSRLLTKADHALDNAFTIQCQRGIKRRFLLGDIKAQAAIDELIKRGTTNERATKLVDWWGCEKSANGRAVAANRLCGWLANGSITASDFSRRLQNIGYTEHDAALMVSDCLTAISVQRTKQAQKEAKEEMAASKRAEQAAKQQEAAMKREEERQRKAAIAAAKARTNRESQLLTAGDKLRKQADVSLSMAVETVRYEYNRVRSQYGLSVDDSLKTITLAVEGMTGTDLSEYSEAVTTLAEAASEFALSDAG